jgi:hypothetical protein
LNRVTPGPLAPASRIVEVDTARGFALFGVLLVNMSGCGADSIAWNSPADRLAFAFMRVFFEWKSWTLFAVLFGFGFAVRLGRLRHRSRRDLGHDMIAPARTRSQDSVIADHVGEPSVCTKNLPTLSPWSQLALVMALLGAGLGVWRWGGA